MTDRGFTEVVPRNQALVCVPQHIGDGLDAIPGLSTGLVKLYRERGYPEAQVRLHLAHKARAARRRAIQAVADLPRPVDHRHEVSVPQTVTPLSEAETCEILLDWYFPKPREPRLPPVLMIQTIVAREYSISVRDILSERRTQDIIEPRFAAMYLCRLLRSDSLPRIGSKFGKRDHTTVLNGIRKTEARIAADDVFAARIEALRAKIEACA